MTDIQSPSRNRFTEWDRPPTSVDNSEDYHKTTLQNQSGSIERNESLSEATRVSTNRSGRWRPYTVIVDNTTDFRLIGNRLNRGSVTIVNQSTGAVFLAEKPLGTSVLPSQNLDCIRLVAGAGVQINTQFEIWCRGSASNQEVGLWEEVD